LQTAEPIAGSVVEESRLARLSFEGLLFRGNTSQELSDVTVLKDLFPQGSCVFTFRCTWRETHDIGLSWTVFVATRECLPRKKWEELRESVERTLQVPVDYGDAENFLAGSGEEAERLKDWTGEGRFIGGRTMGSLEELVKSLE
jgi:hypothetical protein